MLYVIRHGRTDWNDWHKLQGRTDIPLNEEGRRMAIKAGEDYKDVHFDVCFCSPLIRAKETADLILKDRNVPVYYDERLIEMAFGVCEGAIFHLKGQSVESCTKRDGDHVQTNQPNWVKQVRVFFEAPEKYITPVEGGESITDLFKRTGDFLEKEIYPRLRNNEDILIVGHGAMNSAIVCQVHNTPIEQFWSAGIENCKLMKLI